jgi:hypothetical protein
MKKISACLAVLFLLSSIYPACATDVVAPMSLLNGHIEVHTDSPHNGATATNSTIKHSQGYNVTLGDGLGRGVDGHFHDYDTVNGVTYVDLFRLEPRRGLASLATEYQGAAPCGNVPNDLGVEVDGKCLAAVEGELNRAYDTLQTDANGNPETGLAAEVYTLDGSTPLDPNQKFIVVLANADRSGAGILQIGCRSWPVVAYQDMITSSRERNGTLCIGGYRQWRRSDLHPGGYLQYRPGHLPHRGICDPARAQLDTDAARRLWAAVDTQGGHPRHARGLCAGIARLPGQDLLHGPGYPDGGGAASAFQAGTLNSGVYPVQRRGSAIGATAGYLRIRRRTCISPRCTPRKAAATAGATAR